jgi:hypothetical protein
MIESARLAVNLVAGLVAGLVARFTKSVASTGIAVVRRVTGAQRGTSWISVILGSLAALGAGLILSSIVGAILGGG